MNLRRLDGHFLWEATCQSTTTDTSTTDTSTRIITITGASIEGGVQLKRLRMTQAEIGGSPVATKTTQPPCAMKKATIK